MSHLVSWLPIIAIDGRKLFAFGILFFIGLAFVKNGLSSHPTGRSPLPGPGLDISPEVARKTYFPLGIVIIGIAVVGAVRVLIT